MTLQPATLAVVCLVSLIAAAGLLPRAGWLGTGHTVLFHEIRVGALGLFGQDIGATDRQVPEDRTVVPMQAFTVAGAAHAAVPGDDSATGDASEGGFWGGYQGYLADPDGHVWSGKQR